MQKLQIAPNTTEFEYSLFIPVGTRYCVPKTLDMEINNTIGLDIWINNATDGCLGKNHGTKYGETVIIATVIGIARYNAIL